MSTGAIFKLTEAARTEVAQLLHEYECDFAIKYSASEAWRESGFGREIYYSLKKNEDAWRQRQTVEKVAEKLGREPHEIVRLVRKEESMIAPSEYFEIDEDSSVQSDRIKKKIEKLETYERSFIEAVIEQIQEFGDGTSVPVLSTASDIFFIARKQLKLNNESIVEEAKRRKPKQKRRGFGLAPSNAFGIISISLLESIEKGFNEGRKVDLTMEELFDISVALKILPSNLIDRDSPLHSRFSEAERQAISKFDSM